MYESKDMPLIPFCAFLKRMLSHFGIASLLIIITLIIGTVGHMIFDNSIKWHDAALNSAFIANGIGPYIVPQGISGKIFFAIYVCYQSGFYDYIGCCFGPNCSPYITSISH